MADTVSTEWIYPPGWDGSAVAGEGHWTWDVLLNSVSDGTGESGVVKVDLSALRVPGGFPGQNGKAPSRLAVQRIEWEVQGFTSVLLEFDHAANVTIARLQGTGEHIFSKAGFIDPKPATDGTGDVLLTSSPTVGGTYTIRLKLIAKA